MNIRRISRLTLLLLLKIIAIEADGFSQLNGDYGSYSPSFEKKVIEQNRDDGYWVEAFRLNDHTPTGLIGYGLTKGEIYFYQNPSTITEPINGTLIQKLDSPVGMNQADVSGDGHQDIIISFQYGKTFVDCDPDGGKIGWLENPGANVHKKFWTRHYVGKSPSMHRVISGHFTQTERLEIIGLPVIAKPFDLLSPIPVLLFRQPADVFNATEWPSEVINADFFHIIHEVKRFKDGDLDKLLIASREGLSWMSFNQNSKQWTIDNIAQGEQGVKQQTSYYGSGSVDIGRVGNDSLSYIATGEPFHGHVVSVYSKTAKNTSEQVQWKRYVLDIYGYPNESGEGPVHQILCADFDNDGDDEFLVALRGPFPNEGVYMYKPIDISRGLFAKWKVSDDSAARIAVADFDNDTLLDFATISYDVPHYYRSNSPTINIFYNRFTHEKPLSRKELQVIKQNNELVFKVSRPNKALQYEALSFLTVGGINLSLEIIPPFSSRLVDNNTYVKVLSGMIMWTDSSKNPNQSVDHSRTFLCNPKSVCSLATYSDNGRIKTGRDGALLIVYTVPNGVPQFDDIAKIIVQNSLPDDSSEETRQLDFTFVKYTEGHQEKFKDLEFYNLRGFDIKFSDNDEHLCYIQFWAAGQGVDCGVHNHASDSFGEVHASIVNGNGNSGMHYLNSSRSQYDPLTTPDSAFEKLVVPSLYEHGPLWEIDSQNKAVLRDNGTVVYPWHKWQSAINPSFNQSFDVWMVFEFDMKYSDLPSVNLK